MCNKFLQKICVDNNYSHKSIDVLNLLIIGCAAIVIVIWPVIHTMALRNLLLFSGGTLGLWNVIRERHHLFQRASLPLLLLGLVFIWQGLHYLCFSHSPSHELAQISSIWLRALLACSLGIGTGLVARKNRRFQYILLCAILASVLLFYIDYVWVGIASSNWEIPYRIDLGFYGLKNAVLFFGFLSLSVCCAIISYGLVHAKKDMGIIFFSTLLYLGLTFLSFILAGTKSGVALGLIMMLCLFAIYFISANKSHINMAIVAVFACVIGVSSYWHLKITPQWDNFLSTVTVGVQIDKYPNWQDINVYGLPELPDGSRASESPYVRVSSATEGLKLLLKYPLGYGLIDKSYKYLTREDLPNAPSLLQPASQSGWIDFALGVGLPGLLITWAAMAATIFYSFKRDTLWAYCARWILSGSFLVWVVGDVSENHFVEALFYLIALFSAGIIPDTGKFKADLNPRPGTEDT